MSLERVLKALLSLGISETDAQVYIYLAIKGPKQAGNIIIDTKVTMQQVHRSLQRLYIERMIRMNDENPAEFSALPFEEVLDMLIHIKKKQALAIKKRRKKILSSWEAKNE